MHLSKHLFIGLVAVLTAALCTPALAAEQKQLPKVDNFIFLFDASGSMRDNYLEQGMFQSASGTTSSTGEEEYFKFGFAKKAMLSMNKMIPEVDYQAGLYSAATGFQTFVDMEPYDTESMDQAIQKTQVAPRMYGFDTPLADGISKLEPALEGLSGPTAVVVFTDGGANQGGDPAPVVNRLSNEYNTCFHIVSYAQSKDEKKTVNAMAQAKDCSILVSGADMQDRDKMKGFVKRVFYTTAQDSDGDGVFDEKDECPNTPAGVEVDDVGCPVDSDGDGVADYMDECPNTPSGMQVNDQGCPDSDGDGVYDNIDQCPDTEAGVEVDDVGCPFPVSKQIKVQFDFDKATVKDTYHSELQKVADYLKRNPETDMTIKGYTDSTGPAEYNMRLSEKRAANVRDYLVDKLDVDADRLTTKGYGETRPVADNSSQAGRQKNRRVVGVVSK
ncbi:MAG: OmpA family protein [Desulfovermiculus sp.]